MTGPEPTKPCPVCGAETPLTGAEGSHSPEYDCRRCGYFRLRERAAMQLYLMVGYHTRPLRLLPNHHLVSARIRSLSEQSGGEVVEIEDTEVFIRAARALSDLFEAIDRILIYFAKKANLGEYTSFSSTWDYPLGYVRDADEFAFLLEKAIEMEYLERRGSNEVRVALGGWRRIAQLRSEQPERNKAFVAMRFTDELRPAFQQGFEPALLATGYQPLRVDLIQHNDKIDDRIIAEIRKCGLLVADFTGQRQNVYFEAGFALGLGRRVIWTCREGDVRKLHFDIRQYNFLPWRDPAHLREILQARIEATISARARRSLEQ
jgi:hypothetical protein